MTPDVTRAEDLAVVRTRLEGMVALAEAIPCHEMWSPLWISYNRRNAVPDFTFIAAASPDLLLRVAREALDVLDRHSARGPWPYSTCRGCSSILFWPDCPEVASVLRAWQQ